LNTDPAPENVGVKLSSRGRRRKEVSKKIQIAHRRAQLLKELERNPAITMPELAERFKINEQTVWRDMKAITTFYQNRAMDSREAWVGKMLQHYDSIYAQADAAWEKSCEDKKVKVVQAGGEGGGFTQSRKESQHGDSSLLKTKLTALAAMSKLLGLDAPTKVNAELTIHLAGIPEISGLAARLLQEYGAPPEATARLLAGARTIIAKLAGPIDAPVDVAMEGLGDEGEGEGEE
jgi:hypothetical protein